MLIRFVFAAHRYLGMSIGLIMAIWCLSGFVMMYVPYPDITQKQQLKGLAPLDLAQCCELSSLGDLGLVDIHRFRVEMLGDTPVIRIFASGGRNPTVNLQSGEEIRGITGAQAERIAQTFKRRSGIDGAVSALEVKEQDQWTVTAFFDRHRPLYFFSADDEAQSQWYVSSQTGQVMQYTTGGLRFWNWFGAIPHWLYPTVLRQHDNLWAQIVIWASVLGTFLTVIGLYIGIRQWRRRLRAGRSPYRGVFWWHHYVGLIFGVLILTWVFSGLLSMNPWNVIDFSGGTAERQRLQGVPLYTGEVTDFLSRLQSRELPNNTVRIEGYALLGKLYYLLYDQAGSYRRYDGATLALAPVTQAQWPALVNAAAGNRPVADAGMMHNEDAYYYRHKNEREFPVYRVLLDDAEQTRLYFSPATGELLAQVDRSKRVYRWLFSALHQGDFAALIRQRPLWDILMWLALLGVTAGTVTGAYMGLRRMFR